MLETFPLRLRLREGHQQQELDLERVIQLEREWRERVERRWWAWRAW
jgi:hypothetical protein